MTRAQAAHVARMHATALALLRDLQRAMARCEDAERRERMRDDIVTLEKDVECLAAALATRDDVHIPHPDQLSLLSDGGMF